MIFYSVSPSSWVKNVMEVIASKCFLKFFECSMVIKSFWRLQHSRKDVRCKISAFCSYEKKNLVIRRIDERYQLRKQKSKYGMPGDLKFFSIGYRKFQYWKDLRLKCVNERKSSSRWIGILQRKLKKIETRKRLLN